MSARDQWSVRQDPMQVAIRMSHNLIRPGITGVVWALVELTSTAVKMRKALKDFRLTWASYLTAVVR